MSKISSQFNGLYMLQKLEMPSFLAHDTAYQTPNTKSPSVNRVDQSPVDRPSPAVDDLPGSWPNAGQAQTPNGMPGRGTNTSLHSLTNGRMTDGETGRERASSGKGSMLSLRSKRSFALENEKRSMDIPPASRHNSVSPDDGYFASAQASTVAGSTKSPTAKSAIAVGSDTLSTASAKSGHSVQPSTSSALPPLSESSAVYTYPQTADSMLAVPHHPHRASSPPAFSPGAPLTNASPASLPLPNRMIQRHTLEVPKVSSRTSRDGDPPVSDEIIVTASGRHAGNTPGRRRGSSQLARRVSRSIHSDLHLDDIVPDDDAARWAERIKAKRASKRKRDDDDDRVVVGTKVDQNHVNWVTAYNMLTGIRFTVSRTNAKLDRDLTEADFTARHKFSFDITGNELTPSAKYDFKFKDYAPWVFRHLRSHFRLDPADYLVSLTSKYILSELGSPGKSGSFFYFSRDYKYIIKTIHHAEHKFLRKILKEYYDHVCSNPDTLLSQFYGLHRVKIPYGRKIHFVVMNNLFPPHRDIHRTFDLKGSTIGRDFKEEDLEKNPRATLKDLNWLRRNLHLEFGPTKKEAFIAQMEEDVKLLQRLKIMDYSLLVGIHDLERGNEENLRDKTLQVFQPGGEKAGEQPQPSLLFRTPSKLETARKAKELRQLIKNEKPIPMDKTLSKMPDEMLETHKRDFYFYSDDGGFRATHENDVPGEEIYYLGIIDCLTKYNYIKKAEHFWKGFQSPESQISAIPPERYGDRFIKFIGGVTKTRERAEAEKHMVQQPSADPEATLAVEGTVDDPNLAGVNLLKRRVDSDLSSTNSVLMRAEREADRSIRLGANETEVPTRALSAVRSPDANEMATLPVIGEAAENTTASSRSNTATVTPQASKERLDSKNTNAPMRGDPSIRAYSFSKAPPLTPPKTDSTVQSNGELGRGRSFEGPPTPPKSGVWLDKELPLPPGSQGQKMAFFPSGVSEGDMGDLRRRIRDL